jgi:hypothetical protein
MMSGDSTTAIAFAVVMTVVGFMCMVHKCESNESHPRQFNLPYAIRVTESTTSSNGSYIDMIDAMESGARRFV